MVLTLFWCESNYSKRPSKIFLTSCPSLDHQSAAARQHQPPQQAQSLGPHFETDRDYLCFGMALWPVELKTQQPPYGPTGLHTAEVC